MDPTDDLCPDLSAQIPAVLSEVSTPVSVHRCVPGICAERGQRHRRGWQREKGIVPRWDWPWDLMLSRDMELLAFAHPHHLQQRHEGCEGCRDRPARRPGRWRQAREGLRACLWASAALPFPREVREVATTLLSARQPPGLATAPSLSQGPSLQPQSHWALGTGMGPRLGQ